MRKKDVIKIILITAVSVTLLAAAAVVAFAVGADSYDKIAAETDALILRLDASDGNDDGAYKGLLRDAAKVFSRIEKSTDGRDGEYAALVRRLTRELPFEDQDVRTVAGKLAAWYRGQADGTLEKGVRRIGVENGALLIEYADCRGYSVEALDGADGVKITLTDVSVAGSYAAAHPLGVFYELGEGVRVRCDTPDVSSVTITVLFDEGTIAAQAFTLLPMPLDTLILPIE